MDNYQILSLAKSILEEIGWELKLCPQRIEGAGGSADLETKEVLIWDGVENLPLVVFHEISHIKQSSTKFGSSEEVEEAYLVLDSLNSGEGLLDSYLDPKVCEFLILLSEYEADLEAVKSLKWLGIETTGYWRVIRSYLLRIKYAFATQSPIPVDIDSELIEVLSLPDTEPSQAQIYKSLSATEMEAIRSLVVDIDSD